MCAQWAWLGGEEAVSEVEAEAEAEAAWNGIEWVYDCAVVTDAQIERLIIV